MRFRAVPVLICAAIGAPAPSALAQGDRVIEQLQDAIERIVDGPAVPSETVPVDEGAEAGDEVAPAEFQGGVVLPEDPALRRRLAQAVRFAANGRPDAAAEALGRLAESIGDADRFVRVDAQSLRSVKAEVQRLIGESPQEVREAYEFAFGPAARRMLDESPADPAMIRRIATLYPHTAAGADALYRLARVCGDEGAFAEAAACLDRLLAIHPEAASRFEPTLSVRLAGYRASGGDRAEAKLVLDGAAKRFPTALVTIAGAEAKPLEGLPAEAVFRQVAGQGGTGSRNFTPPPGDADAPVPVAAEPFLIPRWSVVIDDADAITEQGRQIGATIPAVFPTVAGDLALVPTGDGFTAFDLQTGTRLWVYPSEGVSMTPADSVWTGLAKGRLSTDGRSVFLVEYGGRGEWSPPPQVVAPGPVAQQQWGFFPVQGPFAIPNASVDTPGLAAGPATNFLTALDVTAPRQGNCLWRIGGESGGDEPRLARHTFLGPPLAANGRLYAIADHERTVRLVVLEAATGRLEWSLDLGQAEVPLVLDPQRRRVGATPTLTRGVLICPTAGGSVVAVDLAGRSLLWGFRYPRSVPPAVDVWGGNVPTPPDVPGWIDGTVCVAGDRMLLTPPEAGDVYCIDLRTGQLRWHRSRGEDFFIAAADAERLLLVGRTGTTLVNAVDGATIGTPAPFPDGAAPSGCGYRDGAAYVQPLSDGSLLRVELGTGSASVAARPVRPTILGNLIWHNGALLSLGPGFLRAFDGRARLEAEIAAKIATRPDDPVALLRRADLHSEAGRYAEAIADCRQAFAADPSPAVRNRLVAALLDGLRGGLPEAANYDAELDRLAGHR